MELEQTIVKKSSELADSLLKGTQFADDREVQALIEETKEGFKDILDTEPGSRLVHCMEKLGGKIKTEASFFDAVKVIFRLVGQFASSPMVKFGLFLLGIGALIAIVGSLPFVAESAIATWVVRLLCWLVPMMCGICGVTYHAVTSCVSSIKGKIEVFFSKPSLDQPKED